MKQVFSYYLVLITLYSFADMPGNKPRPDYDVKISGLNEYKDYTFYFQGYDSAAVLKDSSSIHVQGGMGAPMCVNVWAVQQKSNKYTDTLNFCSGDAEANKAIVIQLSQFHLTYVADTTMLSEKNKVELSADLVKEQDKQSIKNRNVMYLISGLSFVVLMALVFFVWNKNRTSKNQKP